MSKKLYVGGLSWNTDNDKLKEAFEKYGEVSEANVITDRDSGRSRGFGFVTFVDATQADKAIEEMNDKELDGRMLKVNQAKDRKPRTGGGSNRW